MNPTQHVNTTVVAPDVKWGPGNCSWCRRKLRAHDVVLYLGSPNSDGGRKGHRECLALILQHSYSQVEATALERLGVDPSDPDAVEKAFEAYREALLEKQLAGDS